MHGDGEAIDRLHFQHRIVAVGIVYAIVFAFRAMQRRRRLCRRRVHVEGRAVAVIVAGLPGPRRKNSEHADDSKGERRALESGKAIDAVQNFDPHPGIRRQ